MKNVCVCVFSFRCFCMCYVISILGSKGGSMPTSGLIEETPKVYWINGKKAPWLHMILVVY